jgi:single-strand DNA-binding protein
MKETSSGREMTKITVASDRRYFGKGEKQTDFLDCVTWGHTAKFVAEYGHKGDLVSVVGELQVRSADMQDGSKRKFYEVNVQDLQILSAKKQAEERESEPQQVAVPNPYVDVQTDFDPFADD